MDKIIGFYDLITLVIFSFLLLFTIYSVWISYNEKEKLAALKLLGISVIFSLFIFVFINFLPNENFSKIFLTFSSVAALLLFIPFNKKNINNYKTPNNKIDERDIMFSRRLLNKGSDRYKDYYEKNPDKEELDKKFRQKPGLLNEKSSMYNPLLFASSHSTFNIVDLIKYEVNGNVNEEKKEFKKSEITKYIKEWIKHLGALDCGVTLLKDYHKYSVGVETKIMEKR